jgi:hypothetical protein
LQWCALTKIALCEVGSNIEASERAQEKYKDRIMLMILAIEKRGKKKSL